MQSPFDGKLSLIKTIRQIAYDHNDDLSLRSAVDIADLLMKELSKEQGRVTYIDHSVYMVYKESILRPIIERIRGKKRTFRDRVA